MAMRRAPQHLSDKKTIRTFVYRFCDVIRPGTFVHGL